MPKTSQAMFMAGVFLMFAPVGVLADLTDLGADPFSRLVTNVLFSGGIAVVYVVVARRPQWLAQPSSATDATRRRRWRSRPAISS